jgi:uncharacterized protein (TIGR02246 family)
MRVIGIVVLMLVPSVLFAADVDDVRQVVQKFYTAYDEGFVKPVDFATEDWYHINPYGGVLPGLEATLKDVREVHTTFLKGVTDTPEDIRIRFASRDVAIATVVSNVSAFKGPDGVTLAQHKNVRTFVVVKRGDRWLIMQDHNTNVAPPPG